MVFRDLILKGDSLSTGVYSQIRNVTNYHLPCWDCNGLSTKLAWFCYLPKIYNPYSENYFAVYILLIVYYSNADKTYGPLTWNEGLDYCKKHGGQMLMDVTGRHTGGGGEWIGLRKRWMAKYVSQKTGNHYYM